MILVKFVLIKGIKHMEIIPVSYFRKESQINSQSIFLFGCYHNENIKFSSVTQD